MKSNWTNRLISTLVPPVIGAGVSQVLSILVYHRVLPEEDYLRPGVPSVSGFSWQMELIARNYNVIPLGEAVQRLKENRLPPRAACITFDDGYADNYELALPILNKWKLPATVYVSTSFLDGGRMWNDTIIESIRFFPNEELLLDSIIDHPVDLSSKAKRLKAVEEIIGHTKYLDQSERQEFADNLESMLRRSGVTLPDNLMLTTQQLQNLHQKGVNIGGHTVTHPILLELSEEDAKREIADGRDQLQSLIQDDVDHFAYPNGVRNRDFDHRHEEMVREVGFKSAVTTHWGVSDKNSCETALPRFTPWDSQPQKFALRMALNMRDRV